MTRSKHALPALGILVAATTMLQPSHINAGPYLSVKEQRTAIVDCQYSLGFRGWPRLEVTYTETPWGGPSVVRVLPDSTLSAHDAARINACADAKLGREGPKVVEREVQTSCPRGASILFGGAGYCPSG